MSNSPLRPHLHPQEIARRQRWVAVGVTILTILLIATWVVTLPARISKSTGSNTGWRAILGEVPQGTFIDSDSIINSDERKKNDDTLLKSVVNALDAASSTAAVAATTTVATTPTSTPAPVPNKK